MPPPTPPTEWQNALPGINSPRTDTEGGRKGRGRPDGRQACAGLEKMRRSRLRRRLRPRPRQEPHFQPPSEQRGGRSGLNAWLREFAGIPLPTMSPHQLRTLSHSHGCHCTAATAPRRSDVPPTGARAARVSDLLAAPFAVAVDVSRAPCLPAPRSALTSRCRCWLVWLGWLKH